MNLGTGNGYSVLQVVQAYSKACGRDLPYDILPRRAGDVAECYADPTKAFELLGWEGYSIILIRLCKDSWNFTQMNPNGIE